MKAKLIWAILISFGIYLFPIPTIHANFMWGEMLWDTISNNHLTTLVGRILISIFAIAYQCFTAFCLYQLFKIKPPKIFIATVPLIILLYFGLVIGQYLVGFLIFTIERMLGIAPV